MASPTLRRGDVRRALNEKASRENFQQHQDNLRLYRQQEAQRNADEVRIRNQAEQDRQQRCAKGDCGTSADEIRRQIQKSKQQEQTRLKD
jgi:hypothetical protein